MKLNQENLYIHDRLGIEFGKLIIEVSREQDEEEDIIEYEVRIYKDQRLIDIEEYETIEEILEEWDLPDNWKQLK